MENTSPKPLVRWIETAANVAIIIVAVAIVAVFAKNHFYPSQQPRPSISAGAKLNSQPVDWAANGKNVVLVLSTTCHFCKESSGFYQRLTQDCRNAHTRTVAFFPQTPEEAQNYLKSESVQVDQVIRADFKNLEIGGTPTLLLVDGSGIVKKVWLGKLDDQKEREVLAQSCSASS
ncbi:MAG: hypothetical protein DMG65_07630 [Candidatus Angelobacter sp. Gp1-AA117]|nr:MAG: hypothetical protein DMG65_07630 [Candidatus Angelobacter sp. Gp1-AA117]